jgi:hypothetical protein
MDDKSLEKAELLIANKETVGKCFIFEEGMTHLSGASVFTMRDQKATRENVMDAKKRIEKKVGVFSEIRGTAMVPLVCMTAMQDDPDSFADRAVRAYKELKTEFFSSPYLALASFLMAEEISEDQFEEVTGRAKQIYRLMKKDHPFLTGEKDSPICVLMALSGKDEVALTEDAAACYQILKPEFFSGSAVESLANVLAMYDGTSEDKCRRTIDLFNRIKEAGIKYGTSYELATLAPLAMSGEDPDTIAAEIQETEKWLSGQKGFGFFSGISEKQRYMYAGMLNPSAVAQPEAQKAMAISSAISIMVMEDTILYCSINSSIILSNTLSASGK